MNLMETLAKSRQNARGLGAHGGNYLSELDLMDALTAQLFQPAVSREVIRRDS
jgi:hypothetical protein